MQSDCLGKLESASWAAEASHLLRQPSEAQQNVWHLLSSSAQTADWSALVDPETTFFASIALSLLSGLAGFVILFGPHVSPKNYRTRNIGAALFFAGLLLIAVSLIAAAIGGLNLL